MKPLDTFRSLLKEKGIKKALLFSYYGNPSPNFVYFTGLRDVTGCLVIRDKVELHVCPLEVSIAKKDSFVRTIKPWNKKFMSSLKRVTSKVGMDYSYLRHGTFLEFKKWGMKMVDVGEHVKEMRIVKTDEEINCIKKACKITDTILEDVHSRLNMFITEKDVEKFILQQMLEYGVEKSFDPIVASGKNSANMHHSCEKKKLGGLTVIDLGVVYKNYCSDVTRTFLLGKKDPKLVKLYELVYGVQEECRDMVTEGVLFGDIHKYAAKKIGKKMGHGLGHGLGLQVHESPVMTRKLQENMVITIEPGAYVPSLGGVRIEDDIVVGKGKCKVLSRFPREIL